MNHPIDTEDKRFQRSGSRGDPAGHVGEGKGFSSPSGERTESKIPPTAGVRGNSSCSSGCPDRTVSDPAESGQDTRESACPTPDSKRLNLLDKLIDKIIARLDDDSCQPKIRDALKAIQLRDKVAKASEAERIFWDLIEEIKREEFSGLCPVPASLKSQIKETILGLKGIVTNGILPLKSITEAFNQTRSQQARLTCRRMSRLLSAMGFTKAKTSNGCSAIIWDDQLLPQDTSFDAQNPTKEEA